MVVFLRTRLCRELIVERLERLKSPLTDSVASFLITFGWFVNIIPLWFNLLCAVRQKLFPEDYWRGLLIYLRYIYNVFAGAAPDLLYTKANRGNVDPCWPKILRGTLLNSELDDLRARLSFSMIYPPIFSSRDRHLSRNTQPYPLVCCCRPTLMGSPL